jgi:hypothetical protein
MPPTSHKSLIMRLIILIFLLSITQHQCTGQEETKHTYQFGYGKQFLEFKAPSHHFLISYQRNYKSRFFWSIRSEFAAEEEFLRRYDDDGIYLFQYGEGTFAYEDLIETDDIDSGLIPLETLDEFVLKFKMFPNVGYDFFDKNRTIGLNVAGGFGMIYEKFKGPYSASQLFLIIEEEGYELEEPFMNIEGYKSGFEAFVHFGFQLYFNLKNNYQIGFDATLELYQGLGGFPITHNFYLAKKF